MKLSYIPDASRVVCELQVLVHREDGGRVAIPGYIIRGGPGTCFDGSDGFEYTIEVSEHLPSAATFVLANDEAAKSRFQEPYDANFWGGYWRDVLAFFTPQN